MDLRSELKEVIRLKDDYRSTMLIKQLDSMRVRRDPHCIFNEILQEGIIWAAKDGYGNGVQNLIDLDISADCKDPYGNTPLILSSEAGHVNIVKILLSKMCDVNGSDLQTRSALHWSAMNGHKEVVKLLLSYNAEADVRDKVYGYTPLMLAARQGHAEIVECLLDRKCNPNQVDIHNETALFDAVRNGKINCAKLLLDAGARVNDVDECGRTLLLTAVLWSRVSIVALLVKLNCKTDIAGVLQYTQSRLFAQNFDFEIKNMFTPIEAALIENKQDIYRILYVAGSNLSFSYKYAYDVSFRECVQVMTHNEEHNCDLLWLFELIDQPRSLKEQCRQVIRRACDCHLSIGELPLPPSLKVFLTLPEIDVYL